jgi:hypothetical protein
MRLENVEVLIAKNKRRVVILREEKSLVMITAGQARKSEIFRSRSR